MVSIIVAGNESWFFCTQKMCKFSTFQPIFRGKGLHNVTTPVADHDDDNALINTTNTSY